MLSDVASSLSERHQERALSRITSNTPTARNTLTLTAHETYMLPGDHHHCRSISSHLATNRLRSLEQRRHAVTSAHPMTVTHSPIYKGGSYLISSRHCHSARHEARPSKLHPLEPRATTWLPERSHIIYYA